MFISVTSKTALPKVHQQLILIAITVIDIMEDTYVTSFLTNSESAVTGVRSSTGRCKESNTCSLNPPCKVKQSRWNDDIHNAILSLLYPKRTAACLL